MHSTNGRILRGALTIGVFVVLAKSLALLKDIVIANQYGVSAVVDAYNVAFAFTMWIPGVWASVLPILLVPLLLKWENARRTHFTGELVALSIYLGSAVCLAYWLYIAFHSSSYGSSAQLDTRTRLLILSFTWFSLLIPVKLIVTAFRTQLLSLLDYRDTLSNALPPLLIGLVVIVFGNGVSMWPLIAGTVFGFVAQLIYLASLIRCHGKPVSIVWKIDDIAASGVFRFGAAVVVGQMLIGLMPVIDNGYAIRQGEGVAAVLGYAYRIVSIGLELGAVMVARALLPILSENRTSAQSYAITRYWLLVVMVGGVLAALLLSVCAPLLVSMLYEHGEFDARHTEQVSYLIAIACFQIPLYLGGIVLVQLFAAMGRYRIVAASSFVAIVVKLVSISVLSESLGVSGIVYSNSVVYFASLVFLLICALSLQNTESVTKADKNES